MMEKVLSKELKLLSELKGLTDSQLKTLGYPIPYPLHMQYQTLRKGLVRSRD